MTDGYTPPLDAVRSGYAASRFLEAKPFAQAEAEFDRFVDAIRAGAWDEGAKVVWEESGEGFNGEYNAGEPLPEWRTPNPYRKEADA